MTNPSPPVKVLVLYDSLTGNVEQMAKFVAEGASEIQGVEVRIRKITADCPDKATPEDVLWADGVAVGSPTNMGVLSSDEGKHATLINGIAWWPERDVRDVVRSKVLKTAEFAWAASPTGPEPVVFPGNPLGTDVFPEGPKPGQPALKFVGPRRGEGDVGCTVSRQVTAR